MDLVLLVGSFRSIVPEGSDGPIGSQGGFVDALGPAPYSLANAYLKAFVEADPAVRARFEIRLLDLAEPLEIEEEREEVALSERDLERIVDNNPAIIGFSTYCWNLDTILDACAAIKGHLPDATILLGGRLAAEDAREILTLHSGIDAVVVGEGELPFRDILRSGSVHGIAGVFARDGSEARSGGRPRSVQVLDDIPSPWLAGILSPEKNAIMMELSRGCRHACGYCAWNSDKRLRFFSAERIERELAWMVAHGHEHVTLNDSAINYDTDRLRAFVQAVQQADPAGVLQFTYNLRHDALTEAQLRALSALPTHMVLLGIETLSRDGMRRVNREDVDIEALRSRLDALAHAVRPPVASIVLGLPDDDEEGFMGTLDTLMSWTEPGTDGVPSVGTVLVSLLQVYRGSSLWTHRRELGLSFETRGIPYLHESPTWPAAALARCKAELVRRIRTAPERLKAAEALALIRQRGGVSPWLSPRVMGIVLRDWPQGVVHDGWMLERSGWMRDTGQGALLRFCSQDGQRVRVAITLNDEPARSRHATRYRTSVRPLPGAEVSEASLQRLGQLVRAVVRRGEHRARATLAERQRRAKLDG